jgi:hypothetical protein
MQTNFLQAYSHYADGNEASPLFHEWAGLNTLSAVVSRKVFFDQKYFLIYPNIYVILVGEPGDKKTTAMSLARTMVQKLEMPLAPPSITKEAISLMMSQSTEGSKCHIKYLNGTLPVEVSQLSFFASEIVTMLAAGGNAQGLIEFFTDIYDRETFEVVTKGKGTDFINCPYITILACMTPEQTGQLLKERLITGGFSRRCIFVYGRSKAAPIAFPELLPTQIEAKQFCIDHLQKVKRYHAKYDFTPDAREYFKQWYETKHRQLSLPHSPAFKNWLRSKDTMAIKVAMLLDLAQGMSGKIDQPTIHDAVLRLDKVEGDIGKVFAGAGKNPLAELASKIISRLEEAPNNRLTKKQIIASMFEDGDMEQIAKAIDYLNQTDIITRGVTGSPNPTEILSLTQRGQ